MQRAYEGRTTTLKIQKQKKEALGGTRASARVFMHPQLRGSALRLVLNPNELPATGPREIEFVADDCIGAAWFKWLPRARLSPGEERMRGRDPVTGVQWMMRLRRAQGGP